MGMLQNSVRVMFSFKILLKACKLLHLRHFCSANRFCVAKLIIVSSALRHFVDLKISAVACPSWRQCLTLNHPLASFSEGSIEDALEFVSSV